MQFNTNLMNSTDTELLAVLLGNRKTAESLLRKCERFLVLAHAPDPAGQYRPVRLPDKAHLFRRSRFQIAGSKGTGGPSHCRGTPALGRIE